MPQTLIPAELAVTNTLRLEAGSSVSFFAVCHGRCAALTSKARNQNMDGLESLLLNKEYDWGNVSLHFYLGRYITH